MAQLLESLPPNHRLLPLDFTPTSLNVEGLSQYDPCYLYIFFQFVHDRIKRCPPRGVVYMYNENSMGPRRGPCGSPCKSFLVSDRKEPIMMHCKDKTKNSDNLVVCHDQWNQILPMSSSGTTAADSPLPSNAVSLK